MIVLVTGATGLLGPAVADAFERRGDIVLRASRSGQVKADLTRPEEARRAINEAVAARGGLDVLAHVLGGYEGGSAVDSTTDETWRRMLDINLNAAFYTMRAVLPHLVASGRGRLIAIGSRAGVAPVPDLAAYNVSKAGLHALVQTIALETQHTGTTANVIMPSFIDPDRGVPPAAIAELAVWLTSDAAAHVSGALIPIYGKA
ncbi:MAG TPA: SDR family NAD(P)-dependent oxidoreductase [Bryobacteraceae bacterium]|nr:SDR family NAD(P)-dependent oxidoreductase [Bryobacteraceae bacterium]